MRAEGGDRFGAPPNVLVAVNLWEIIMGKAHEDCPEVGQEEDSVLDDKEKSEHNCRSQRFVDHQSSDLDYWRVWGVAVAIHQLVLKLLDRK
jgi:hypothetical protein